MLNILADALLIAARIEPMRPTDYRTRPEPEAEKKTARRWYSLMGIKL